MKKFEIWMEGYRMTGQSCGASKLGEEFGETFDDAVLEFMVRTNNSDGVEKNTPERYVDAQAYANRKSNWNVFACNLFDNETDARKNFG